MGSEALKAWALGPTGLKTSLFWGPIANWGLAGSGMYDALLRGPEIINERMAATQVLYSGLFVHFAMSFAPRNVLLATCHVANVLAQLNQMRRWSVYIKEKDPENGPSLSRRFWTKFWATAVGFFALYFASFPATKAALAGPQDGLIHKLASYPAGPFTIHFWAPTFKWALSLNNIIDINRPVEKISGSMMWCLTIVGVLFCDLSVRIRPVNNNLLAVNIATFLSSGILLIRKLKGSNNSAAAKTRSIKEQ